MGGGLLRCLLIAPDNDLIFARREVDRVVSALRPTLLSGVVDRARVLEAPRPHDLIWFVSHGTGEGVELSDDLLPLGTIGTLVRMQGASIVFLNTCSSAEVATALREQIGVTVIYTVAEADDLQSYATGSAFAERLAEGTPPQIAFELARPVNNTRYQMLGEGDLSAMPYERNDDLTLLIHAVLGNDRTGDAGLLRNVRELEQRLGGLEGKMSELLARGVTPPASLLRSERLVLVFYCVVMALVAGATLWLSI